MTAEIKTVCEGGIVVHEPVSRLPRVYHDFALLLFCIFPFSVYPILGVLGSIYCARVYGEVFVFWATIASVASLSCPVIFTPSFRRVLQPLYSSFVFYQKRTRYVVPNKPFPPGRTYIFCAHPHGRMFYSFSMFLEMSSVWLRGIVPGYIFGAVNKTLFMLPFLRNWFDLLGLISASKPDLMRKLKQGGNVAIAIGGMQEVCLGTFDDRDMVYLKNRLGFVKLAMETSSGLVPVYFFGENGLFKHEPGWLLGMWRHANRLYLVGVPFFRGRWHLPIPFKRELLVVVGDPLFPEENETAESFHARYIKALKDLYDAHVGLTENPKHKLVIV